MNNLHAAILFTLTRQKPHMEIRSNQGHNNEGFKSHPERTFYGAKYSALPPTKQTTC